MEIAHDMPVAQLFGILDIDCKGNVSKHDLFQELLRLRGSQREVHSALVQNDLVRCGALHMQELANSEGKACTAFEEDAARAQEELERDIAAAVEVPEATLPDDVDAVAHATLNPGEESIDKLEFLVGELDELLRSRAPAGGASAVGAWFSPSLWDIDGLPGRNGYNVSQYDKGVQTDPVEEELETGPGNPRDDAWDADAGGVTEAQAGRDASVASNAGEGHGTDGGVVDFAAVDRSLDDVSGVLEVTEDRTFDTFSGIPEDDALSADSARTVAAAREIDGVEVQGATETHRDLWDLIVHPPDLFPEAGPSEAVDRETEPTPSGWIAGAAEPQTGASNLFGQRNPRAMEQHGEAGSSQEAAELHDSPEAPERAAKQAEASERSVGAEERPEGWQPGESVAQTGEGSEPSERAVEQDGGSEPLAGAEANVLAD